MDKIREEMLAQVADLHSIPQGAFNFRENGKGVQRQTTDNIDIVTKKIKKVLI